MQKIHLTTQELSAIRKLLRIYEESSSETLDHAQLLREDRAFQIYMNLLSDNAHLLASHSVAPDDLAVRSRDYEEEFYRTEEPSDPNLLQFEGIETVFGQFRVNGDETWWVSPDGHQVLLASFCEPIQAIDAVQELNERLHGYPVLKKNE